MAALVSRQVGPIVAIRSICPMPTLSLVFAMPTENEPLLCKG
jgi:hypothetical protein